MIVKLPGYDEEIYIDAHNHVLRLPLKPDKDGRTKYKVYGYYTSVASALRALALAKTIEPGGVVTLDEYLSRLTYHTDRLDAVLERCDMP